MTHQEALTHAIACIEFKAEYVSDYPADYDNDAHATLEEAREVLGRWPGGDLRDVIRAALEGDSNDAEHDALIAVADSLDIEWTSYEDRGDDD